MNIVHPVNLPCHREQIATTCYKSVQISAEPGIELGTLWSEAEILPTAPTTPAQTKWNVTIIFQFLEETLQGFIKIQLSSLSVMSSN